MARSITFNGITRFKPGGITRVNAENLNQVLSSANSIVALVGEAEGGAPGADEGLYIMDDPSGATREFKSGPLADAIRLAFQSSNDPFVPGGASRVYVYKTNASTQATLSLPADEATQDVSSTVTSGTTTTLVDTALTGTVDDQYNGKYIVLRPFTATTEVRLVTDYVSSTTTFTVGTAFAVAPTVSDVYYVYDPEAEVIDAVNTGTSTTTSIKLTDVTVTNDEHNGRWVLIQDTVSTSYLRQITDTVATDELVISPALPAAPTAGAYVQILANVIDLTSKDWGTHTNGISVDITDGTAAGSKVATITYEGNEEVSGDLGGDFKMSVLYKGGTTNIADTVSTTVAATTTVITLETGGLTPSAHVGTQVLIDGEYTIITANTATALTVSPALSSAPAASTPVAIRTVTGGVMAVQGAAGAATGLTTTITGVSGDDLSLTFTQGQTLRELIAAINANANYVATPAPGVNQDTTYVADFDFGLDTEVPVLVSDNLAEEGVTRNLMALVDYFNDYSTYVDAVRATDTGSSVAGCCPPRAMTEAVQMAGGSRGTSTNTTFQAGFDMLLQVRANSVVPLIDEDLTNEGYGSTATWASVAAQLADHVGQARGTAQNKAGERGGYIGFQGTKTEIIAAANSINDYDVHLTAQNPTVLNAAGSLEEFGPRMLAVMGASMRAGVFEVAEPLTFKKLRVSGLTQDSSWSPDDVTDANLFIQNGIMFAETIDGVGTRWVRDITTYVTDDNLAYVEGSVRDAVRYVAFELRDGLVQRFTGKKAKPATIANIKNAAAAILELQRTDNIIVDSTDPATGALVHAWHNLKVYSVGDGVRVNVGFFPVPGINFMLTDLFLQLATQSA